MTDTQQQAVEKVLSDIGLGNVYYYAAQKLTHELAYLFSTQKLEGARALRYQEVMQKIEMLFEPLSDMNYAITDPFIHVDKLVASSNDFMQDENENIRPPAPEAIEYIIKTVPELGFGSVHQYAKQKTLRYLHTRVMEYQNSIARYQAKYGLLDSAQLQVAFDKIIGFGEFEKEDDLMYWEADEDCYKSYNESLIELENG